MFRVFWRARLANELWAALDRQYWYMTASKQGVKITDEDRYRAHERTLDISRLLYQMGFEPPMVNTPEWVDFLWNLYGEHAQLKPASGIVKLAYWRGNAARRNRISDVRNPG